MPHLSQRAVVVTPQRGAALPVPSAPENNTVAGDSSVDFSSVQKRKISAAVAVGILVAGCSGPARIAATTVTITSTLQPVITSTATVTYTPPPPPGPKTTITTEGIYVVGTDILPGTWREPGGAPCYWARLRSLDTSDIIDNSNSEGPQVVQIQPSDKAFQTRGCTTWTRTE